MGHERSRGDRYALTALRKKRATIAGEIVHLERQIRHRKDMLVHVDATSRLLDPSVDLDAIPNKRPPQRIRLFRQGELGRMIKDAIRRNGGEASMHEIVSALLAAGGHGEDARKTVAPRARSNLAYQVRQGTVTKDGKQRDARWRLAQSPLHLGLQ